MKTIGSIKFDSGIVISNIAISKAVDCALKAIRNELPEEAQTYEVYDFIIKASADALKEKTIQL